MIGTGIQKLDGGLMTRIWGKSELEFALLWIAGYVTGNSLSSVFSDLLKINDCANAVFSLSTSLFLLIWVSKNGLRERYGLCKARLPASRFLWYIPLIILISRNLWCGVEVPLPTADTIFSVCNMIGVGFIEELLFRGILFQAVSRSGVKKGVVISSVLFGLGHIVNLFNGHGMDFAENMRQIIFAIAFGFLCVIIFCRGKTIWPCVLTHAAFNITGIFSKTTGAENQIFQDVAVLLLVIGYAWWMARKVPEGSAAPSRERPS